MKKILIVFVTAILLVCAGCDQATNIQNNDEPININDIQVPEDFTYQTSSAVAVNLTVTDALDNPVQGIIFKIYDADPDQNGRFISKGGTLEDGSYETALIVPEGCNELTVVSPMNTLSVPIINGELNYEYEGYTYLHPDTNDPSIKSGNIINNELPGNRNDSKTNLVTNGDFEIDDFGSMGYVWDPFMPSDGRWYFSQDHGSLDWLNDGGNHVVLSPWSYPDNNFNGSACQLIDAEPGDNFTLSVDVKYIGNNLENTFLIGIQGRDSSGVSIWSYSNHYQISASWTTWTSLWDIFYSGSLSVSAISVYFNIGDQNTDGSLYVDNFVVTKLAMILMEMVFQMMKTIIQMMRTELLITSFQLKMYFPLLRLRISGPEKVITISMIL